MPRIFKPGRLPETNQYKTMCHNCGTGFVFAEGEAQLHSSMKHETHLSINCPFCKQEVWITTPCSPLTDRELRELFPIQDQRSGRDSHL